jgi:hypothetical protein
MKKWLKGIGITLVILLIILVSLPFIFEKKIVRIVKSKMNEQLNAVVDFKDYSFGIFRTFPDFNLRLDSLTVDGTGAFEGVQLASIETFAIELDIMSVINGEEIQIKDFSLINPVIKVRVLEDGTANWDIVKSTEEVEADTTTEESVALANLQSYSIENGYIDYKDLSMGVDFKIQGLGHVGSGDFSSDQFLLETMTSIDSMDVWMDGIRYMNRAKLDAKIDLDMDLPNFKFTMKENEFKLNELGLNLDGWLAMPGDDINMDLTFAADKAEFKSILSLIPAVYQKDFASVKTSGTAVINGNVKGTYSSVSRLYPGMNININVQNGRFQYPTLPAAVEDVFFDLSIQSEGKREYDDMVIQLRKGSLKLAGNPIQASLTLKTPLSDPDIDAAINGKLQMSDIGKVIPLDAGESYKGLISGDVKLKGRMSAIEQQKYENFDASGAVKVTDMEYKTSALSETVAVKTMDMTFTPQALRLNSLDSKFGRNDFKASGNVKNYLNYFFKDEPVKGDFTFQSDYLNLNDLMSQLPADETGTSAAADSVQVIDLPENVDLSMSGGIKKLIYEDVEIDNVYGNVHLANKTARLSDLTMQMMGGSLGLDGTYDVSNVAKPNVDFKLNIKNWDIKAAADKFLTIATFAPIAKFASGLFSTQINFKTDLDATMTPVFSSVFAGGNLLTDNLDIKGFDALIKLASEMKLTKLASQKISDLAMYFKIEDGRMNVNPYTLKLGNSKATIAGYTGLSQDIFFKINMEVPRSEFGPDANQFIDKLSAQALKLGLKVDPLKTVLLDITAEGTVLAPKFSFKWSDKNEDLLKSLQEQVESKVKEKVDEVKAMAKEKVDSAKVVVKEKIDEAKLKVQAEWNKRADQIIATAEDQATKIKLEAANLATKVRAESESNAKKLEDEAQGFIQKQGAKLAADRLRKEGNDRATQLEQEAVKRADKLLADAKVQAERVRLGEGEKNN